MANAYLASDLCRSPRCIRLRAEKGCPESAIWRAGRQPPDPIHEPFWIATSGLRGSCSGPVPGQELVQFSLAPRTSTLGTLCRLRITGNPKCTLFGPRNMRPQMQRPPSATASIGQASPRPLCGASPPRLGCLRRPDVAAPQVRPASALKKLGCPAASGSNFLHRNLLGGPGRIVPLATRRSSARCPPRVPLPFLGVQNTTGAAFDSLA